VAFSSSLDDDSQGAQFLAPRIPNRALSKRGPCYAFPDVHVANGSTGRGAVLPPPGQSTKHPSPLLPTPNSAEDFFKRARERGAENETDIINDEEVKKELQPGTKNNYRRALALWHQWVPQSHLGVRGN
jgi:hypothetical protein